MDEVDPGSGGAETVEPVALSSTTTSEAGSPKGSKGQEKAEVMMVTTMEEMEGKETLRERFVRASSPKVELSPEEDKSFIVEEDDKGMQE